MVINLILLQTCCAQWKEVCFFLFRQRNKRENRTQCHKSPLTTNAPLGIFAHLFYSFGDNCNFEHVFALPVLVRCPFMSLYPLKDCHNPKCPLLSLTELWGVPLPSDALQKCQIGCGGQEDTNLKLVFTLLYWSVQPQKIIPSTFLDAAKGGWLPLCSEHGSNKENYSMK